MSVIITGTIPKALKPGVKTFWGEYSEEDLIAAKMVRMETTDEAFDEDVLISPFGLMSQKTEGAGVAYDSMTQGYVSRYNQRTRALGFQVSWEYAILMTCRRWSLGIRQVPNYHTSC